MEQEDRKFYVQNMPDGSTAPPSTVFELEKPLGYTLVEISNPLIDVLIDEKYDEHEAAGLKYYKQTRIQLVKARMAGYLTSGNIVDIEEKVASIQYALQNGNWKSAKELLIRYITPDVDLSQTLYDTFLNDFTKYILNKY
jgi:hypothetical protein